MSDLISRQAAIDALEELCDRQCEYSKQQRILMCGACHLGSAFDVIEQLPSAEPERKKGNEKCSNELPCGWCSLFDTPCFGRGGEQDG